MQKHTIILMLLTVSLVACLSPSGGTSPITPTTAVTPPPTSIPTPFTTTTPTNLPPTSIPIPTRPIYTLNTTIDYDRHFVSVEEIILYPNYTGERLESLTLAIAANLWPNCFRLESINVEDTPVTDYALDEHRLDVPLPTSLEPDSATELHLRYSLSLPYTDQAHSLRARIFGYGDLQTNLTNWYPFLSHFQIER